MRTSQTEVNITFKITLDRSYCAQPKKLKEKNLFSGIQDFKTSISGGNSQLWEKLPGKETKCVCSRIWSTERGPFSSPKRSVDPSDGRTDYL